MISKNLILILKYIMQVKMQVKTHYIFSTCIKEILQLIFFVITNAFFDQQQLELHIETLHSLVSYSFSNIYITDRVYLGNFVSRLYLLQTLTPSLMVGWSTSKLVYDRFKAVEFCLFYFLFIYNLKQKINKFPIYIEGTTHSCLFILSYRINLFLYAFRNLVI